MATQFRSVAVATLLAAAGAAFGSDVTNPTDFVTPSSANHPAGEAAPFAIDNTARTKYLNFDELNTGFTVSATGLGIARYLTIVTANDAPARDPFSYTLEGSDDNITFTPIASGSLSPTIDRFSISSSAQFENSSTYVYYRVLFPTVRDAGAANSMQVAEVQLATAIDVTSPDDAVSIVLPKGGTTGANEGVDKLFDNKLNTKLDVQNAFGNTTVTVTPLSGASVITGLSYFSANDDATFLGRTPQFITIEGTNDGTNFTQIHTATPLTAFDNFQDQEFSFKNSAAYTTYRITLGPPAFATDMQIGDLQLFGTADTTAPDNDACASAIAVSAGTISGTTDLSTGKDTTACGSGDAIDVWYRYTAPASGRVEINTCASSTDTTLAVYNTCGGSAVACDDNGCFVQSLVRFNATAGTSYLIRVALTEGDTGPFRLTVIEGPEEHTDVALDLNWNFNGLTHTGEEGQPDNADGYRSISDRGLIIDNNADSIGAGTILGNTGIRYEVVTQAGVLDIVHLGDRNTTDNGGHAFDAKADGDNIGITPNWLSGGTDQSGEQISDLSGDNIVMTADTQIGLLYQISNGGGFFNWTLTFDDNSSATLFLDGPDWFFDQVPGPAGFGVDLQQQLGVFRGSENVDMATTGASLNVVEAVTSVSKLIADGLGDFTGRQLMSMSFSGRTNTIAGHAFIASTVRDAADTCQADFNNDSIVNSQDFFDFLTAFFAAAPNSDFNDDGIINSQDFFDFLTAFFEGC